MIVQFIVQDYLNDIGSLIPKNSPILKDTCIHLINLLRTNNSRCNNAPISTWSKVHTRGQQCMVLFQIHCWVLKFSFFPGNTTFSDYYTLTFSLFVSNNNKQTSIIINICTRVHLIEKGTGRGKTYYVFKEILIMSKPQVGKSSCKVFTLVNLIKII